MYAVNMFYYHWLIKKLLWFMAWQNIARWEIGFSGQFRGLSRDWSHHKTQQFLAMAKTKSKKTKNIEFKAKCSQSLFQKNFILKDLRQ